MSTRRITQETFDAAVRENMEEFDMEPDEALGEAVEQFESQGKFWWNYYISSIILTLAALFDVDYNIVLSSKVVFWHWAPQTLTSAY